LDGQLHPLQPDGNVRRLVARRDRRVPRRAPRARRRRDGPADARPRHRGGMRTARGGTYLSVDGYFTPDSAIRRIGNRSVLMLGGPRALLLQAAHPLVAAGIVDHSRFAAEPWKRLARTMTALYTIVFGTRAEADRVGAIVQAVHASVRGRLREDVGAFEA